ncbi:MAG TPA: hypothetical protein DEW35_04535 [Ruminococcaceae bacterium]|nr:hypothetical protein [Oscillospiraceae bacterium]
MGFLDKLSNAVNSATEKAKGVVDNAKASMEQKKAEKEALEAEMQQKTEEKKNEIINTILSNENNGSLFDGIDKDTLLNFTKNFYDKLLLPAKSVALSKIYMHPYIDGKDLEKVIAAVDNYDDSETPILLIKAENKQLIFITDKSLYFVLCLPENTKYMVKGKVSNDEISQIDFELGEEKSFVKCDGYTFAEFKTTKVITEDFISLTDYFTRLRNKAFDITDAEVDALIKEKIGSKIVSELKKYMVYDDEQFVYFAWGLDSLAAKDYIVCTNKQIIVLDREGFGATSNVHQFYYEDITSASTEQNSNSESLTGYLIDTAVTAATKTCDLYFSVAGAKNKIKTLYKVEAERIVAVYHEYRKAAKDAAAQPQVVVQQATEDPLAQLEKLNKLKEAGIISDEEFNAKKADLLSKI